MQVAALRLFFLAHYFYVEKQYICGVNHGTMDAKITLSFDEAVINKAKRFAAEQNISLSRLTEFLLSKVGNATYRSLDELPVSDWVSAVSEGKVEYVRKNSRKKSVKKDYLDSRR